MQDMSKTLQEMAEPDEARVLIATLVLTDHIPGELPRMGVTPVDAYVALRLLAWHVRQTELPDWAGLNAAELFNKADELALKLQDRFAGMMADRKAAREKKAAAVAG